MWTEPDHLHEAGITMLLGYDGFGLRLYSRLAGDMNFLGLID